MFTFSRHITSTHDHFQMSKFYIFFKLFMYKQKQHFIEVLHKLSARSNTVIFEILTTSLIAPFMKHFFQLFISFGSQKPSLSTLIGLSSRRNPIQSQKQYFPRVYHLNYIIDLNHNQLPYLIELLLLQKIFKCNPFIFHAFINQSIDVQIQIVHF